MVTVFFYLHIFTGSVGRRILIVVPVDTLYRTSIISSSTVLFLMNPFANLSLAPLSLFSIYGPDLGVWPDCWVSAEFLRAPIPRKGSGSTTTTTTKAESSKHMGRERTNSNGETAQMGHRGIFRGHCAAPLLWVASKVRLAQISTQNYGMVPPLKFGRKIWAEKQTEFEGRPFFGLQLNLGRKTD